MFTGVEGYRTDCSQETTRLIDKEVLRLLNEAYDHAKKILLEHKEQLKIVTDELLEKEMLDAQRFYELLGMEVPQPPPPVLRKEEEPPPPPPAEDAEEDTPKDPGNISGEEKRE